MQPLPDMREILERLVGSQYISVFDLFSGYLQVSFRPEDHHKLAFSTRLGVFQPTRLFFGSKNACAAFCLGILRIEIDSDLSDFLAAYFDDLTIHSLSFSDHLVHLRKFLEAIVTVSKSTCRNQLLLRKKSKLWGYWFQLKVFARPPKMWKRFSTCKLRHPAPKSRRY